MIGIVRDTAIAGAPPAIFGDGGRPSGGIVVHIDTARSVTARPGELDVIALSVIGGTRDSVDRIGPVEERLEHYLAESGVPAEVAFTKEDVVAIGELIGSIFVTFFLVFGLFSIAAGVMLIFLIFVMLAAERRSEMGMARAIGMSRLHLTEMFLAEGMAYNLGSAAVGALLGLAVAYLLVFVMGQIFGEFGLSISFHFNTQGFVIAYGLGVVLTFATVAFSAYRAANINIVRGHPRPAGAAAAARRESLSARRAEGVRRRAVDGGLDRAGDDLGGDRLPALRAGARVLRNPVRRRWAAGRVGSSSALVRRRGRLRRRGGGGAERSTCCGGSPSCRWRS